MNTTTNGARDLPRWFGAVNAIVGKIKTGSFAFVLPDGRRFESEGAAPGPHAEVIVVNEDLFARLVRDGDLGFAEAYMDGWWDTPDLQGVLDVVLLNNDSVGRGFPGQGLARVAERLRHWLRRNSRQGSRRNITQHYDLGNAFYGAWLDESMTYSSAMFRAPHEDLAAGQRNKYHSICERMALRDGQHVLEIGCGWGGFAEYAAAERGAKVTALTISRAQHDFAKRRIFEAGLAERVEIAMRDYRDEAGRYDGVASIEMLEAVGEKYWPTYFNALRARLNPGAVAALQVITVADRLFPSYRRSVDFIQKYIFPGGMLPSPTALRREAEKAGLEVLGSVEFGQSYSDTLRLWRATFNDRWGELRGLGFDARFRRMWNFYLTSCAACFRAGTTDVTQVALRAGA